MKTAKVNLSMLIASLLLIFCLPGIVSADVFLKQVTFTQGYEMMGQKMPDNYDTASIWANEGNYRFEMSGDVTILANAKDDMLRILNNTDKTYSEILMSALGDPTKMLGDAATDPHNVQQLQMLQGMAQMMKLSVTVKPTDETKKIGDYNCKKFNIDINMGMAQISSENWATEDIKINYDLLQSIFRFNLAIMPGYKEMMEELNKVKGIIVLSEGTVSTMGNQIKTKTELVESLVKDAPAGTYDIPKDYTEIPYKLPSMGQ
ncbi:MAG: hypothetical protein ABIJ45_04055 [Candidatus Zixiibacteriota bacterium]